MKAYFYTLSVALFVVACLLPFHKTPWTTFGSEMLTFLSALALVLATFYKEKFLIAKPQWLLALFLTIPTVQLLAGQILYFSNALLCTAYILFFWVMIVAGYNLAQQQGRVKVFELFSATVIVIGLLSCVIAILQWLQLNTAFYPYMNILKGNRPYANFAQPNNLATFLTLGLFGVLYFYEKRIAPSLILVPITLIFMLTIALTQSRTAWVVCLFTLGYLAIKQFGQAKRFGFLKLLAWVVVFIGTIFVLPYLNQLIEIVSPQQVTETVSVIERASSGYLRIDMWNQALVAITQHPWIGYGWNQTGMAQIAAFDLYPSHEWYKSAHNVILDLLIWNGIPLGGLILLYFAGWLYWLNKGVRDAESVVATLMVCAILIHSMLEYPIHYAYFLLPMGFLLGFIQSQYKDLPEFNLKPTIVYGFTILSLVVLAMVYRDYDLYKQQSILVNKKQPLTVEQQQVLDQKLWVLTQFNDRIWWIGLNPTTKLSDAELEHIGLMVANLASRYDIDKYAQVLAYNGKVKEAEHQLWILKTLHGLDKKYQDLLPSSTVK